MAAISEYLFYRIIDPHKLIYTKFLRPVVHDEFKEAMLFVFSKLEELELQYWVMDSTRSNLTMQDQKWAIEHLGLLLQGTTLQKFAMIRGNDAMLQIVAESMRVKIYRIFGDKIQLEEFPDLKEALKFVIPDTDSDKLFVELTEVVN